MAKKTRQLGLGQLSEVEQLRQALKEAKRRVSDLENDLACCAEVTWDVPVTAKVATTLTVRARSKASAIEQTKNMIESGEVFDRLEVDEFTINATDTYQASGG